MLLRSVYVAWRGKVAALALLNFSNLQEQQQQQDRPWTDGGCLIANLALIFVGCCSFLRRRLRRSAVDVVTPSTSSAGGGIKIRLLSLNKLGLASGWGKISDRFHFKENNVAYFNQDCSNYFAKRQHAQYKKNVWH